MRGGLRESYRNCGKRNEICRASVGRTDKTADIAECYKSGESISELSQRYADGDIRIQLYERTSGNIQYLDITASDDENTYITITSARRVAS